MTGISEFNFPAFDRASLILRQHGYEVVSPAEHDRELGFDPTGMSGTPAEASSAGIDLEQALLWDVAQVAQCDGVVLLSGWEKSSGARLELAMAAALGKKAMEYGVGFWVDAKELFLQHWNERKDDHDSSE